MPNKDAKMVDLDTLDVCVKNGTAYMLYEDNLFCGYIPIKSRSADPWLVYNGPKLPLTLWREVLAFFDWSYKTTKSETQVRLYFHLKEKKWRAWAFPQERDTGMTTHELPDLTGSEAKKAGLIGGWVVAGTIHHHCASTAFQSGVDKENEKTQNGVHITVGKMDERRYDLHGRVSFKGEFYDIGWGEWFERPPKLEGLPNGFLDDVVEYFLKEAVSEGETFPKAWAENVIVVKKKQENYRGSHGHQPSKNGVTDMRQTSRDEWSPEDSNIANACLQLDSLADENKIQMAELLYLMDTGTTPKPKQEDVIMIKAAYKILEENHLSLAAISESYYYSGVS